MIKLIACDMDGTLLDDSGKLSSEFFNVFESLTNRDIKFTVASGRQYHQLITNFKDVYDNIIYIAENGTMVIYKGKELYSCTLDKKDVRKVVKHSKELKNAFIVLCGKKSAYINTEREDVLKEIKKYYYKHEVVKDFNNIEDEILKISVMDLEGSQNNSYKFFYPRLKDRLQVVVSGELWLDIYRKETNKGTALKLIQQKLGIDEKETMVFGDYYNDVEMLKTAYYSYAMDNAPQGVKEYARFIAKSNKENGVIEKIKEVALSKKGLSH